MIPLIPLLASTSFLTLAAGSFCSLTLGSLLLVIVCSRKHQRLCWYGVSVTLLLCFIIDQHRIQPWAYQTFFYATLFALNPPGRWKSWMIPLAASIYLYSAAGKFDLQFINTVGQDFLFSLPGPLAHLMETTSPETRQWFALVFPATELSIAASLCFKRLRYYAGAAAICMHISLIIVLGPWLENHSSGVLIWNVLLVAQNHYLFLSDRNAASLTNPVKSATTRWMRVRFFVLGSMWFIALFAPCLERKGFWDHWTSWSLYSPHTSRAKIEIHQSAVTQLTQSLQQSLKEDRDMDSWREIDLGTWSLRTRGVPIYPQARYQLCLAKEIADRLNSNDELRVKLQSSSNRWSGQREEEQLLNRDEINRAFSSYWLTPKHD